MNLKNLGLVAKFEYLRTIKRPAFWATTLLMPAFIGIVMFISGYASVQTEEQFSKISESIKETRIVDDSGLINESLLGEDLRLTKDLEEGIEKVKNGDIQLLVYYPDDVIESGDINIYTYDDAGIFEEAGFSTLASQLLKQSILLNIDNADLQKAVFAEFSTNTTYFNDQGEEVLGGIFKLIVPAISLVIFFLSVFISANFLLQSVSEEKENRMIEFILSIIKDDTLIFGKIFGLSGVVLTQLTIWLVLGGLIFLLGNQTLNVEIPVSFSDISIGTILINLYFVVAGFFLFASLMVGIGSVGTSYKDSQNLSSIFIILSIFPMYFVTILFAEPNGLLARAASIFPLTSPMVFLIRNSLGALALPELIFGMLLVMFYVVVGFYLATKLFNLGSLMYSRRPSLKEIIYVFKK